MTLKQRIVVTGGAGFIGANLVTRLVQEGHNVICVDSFLSGRRENVTALLKYSNFELLRQDITQPFNIECDQIYHLACPASPVHYQNNSIKTMKINFLGTLNILGIARRNGARVLLASTSEVYGDPLIHPQTEDYYGNVNPCGPRSCYDEGKRAAEALSADYHRQHGVEVRIARIFNTYGPQMQMQDGRVISNFICQALKNEPLTIYGTGSQTRSFCYIDDLVEGLIRLMNGAHMGPINLGNPREFTVLETAEIIRREINPKLDIVFEQLPKDDPTRRRPDITRAKTLLGWEPKVCLEEGLKKTIDYFKRLMADDNQLAAWALASEKYNKTREPTAATVSST